MPRDGSNVYHVPAGTTAVTDTTIESAKYNAYTADVEQDLNLPRPIVAGGTGASSAAAALVALGAEQAKQIITNYSSDTFVPGSFYSATTATNAPVAAHAFAGICYAADATNMVIEARDLTDANHGVYVRIMSAGVWGAFGGLNVLKAGDTMTGLLTLSGDPSTALQAATKQYVDTKAVVFASDTPPVGGTTNSLWWESDTGLMYFLYNDGDSTQWVLAMPQPDVTQFTSKTYVDSSIAALQAVRYDIAQTLTAAQKSQARANIDALKKNYFINGAMMVSQENGVTPVTLGPGAAYPVDQFYALAVYGGTSTSAQVPVVSPAGSPSRMRVAISVIDAAVAAGDVVFIAQSIEGLRSADLKFGLASAKTITIQFGVKAPAGTYCVAVRNSAANRAYVAEYVIAAGEANTDVVKSVTIPGDVTGTWLTDNGAGLQISWCLMGGTTYQASANTWVATNSVATANQFNFMGTVSNVFELFDVGLYEGAVAPSFQVPDYGSELLLCKRYYYNGVPPCRGVASGTSAAARMGCLHPVTMRIAPTIAMVSAVSVFDGTSALGLASLGANESTPTVLEFESTTASATLTVGRPVLLYQGGGNITVNARM